ncbi:hypothetical protein EVAR_30460_1 [Eumeta japonica]|uniref:Uncharacterized protein n=1 Tax=Eumeta variegata TaxID=151549 RepID=A0A4C1VXH8_EUMVA|nr:hypothetical protein EVAR_30460_1 [Eumeta japonica]
MSAHVMSAFVRPAHTSSPAHSLCRNIYYTRLWFVLGNRGVLWRRMTLLRERKSRAAEEEAVITRANIVLVYCTDLVNCMVNCERAGRVCVCVA